MGGSVQKSPAFETRDDHSPSPAEMRWGSNEIHIGEASKHSKIRQSEPGT